MLRSTSLGLKILVASSVVAFAACGGDPFTSPGGSTSASTGGAGGVSATASSTGGGGDGGSSTSTTGVGGSGGCDADLMSDSQHCGTCEHDCLGGACGAGRCAPVAIDETPVPAYGVAVDEHFVFWTSRGTETLGTSDANGFVRRADLDGAGAIVLASSEAMPTLLALSEDTVYWTDEGGSLATGAGSVKSTGKSQPCSPTCPPIAKGLDRPFGITFANGVVYWTTLGAISASQGTLYAWSNESTTPLFTGLSDPTILAHDAGVLFFSQPYAGNVNAYDLAAGNDALSALALGQLGPDGVAVDGDDVYFTTYAGGKLKRVKRDGTALVELANGLDHPALVALDADDVYWTAYGSGTADGQIQRMKKGCVGASCVETIATGQCGPIGIAVDEKAVYWANEKAGASGCAAGAVMKVAK
jgi:hypothetical protein